MGDSQGLFVGHGEGLQLVSGGVVAPVTYEIRVVGKIGPAAREAFGGLDMDTEPTATVLSGELDQAALHGLLDRVRALGLELVDIRRVRAPSG
jgi:hypothetical protein